LLLVPPKEKRENSLPDFQERGVASIDVQTQSIAARPQAASPLVKQLVPRHGHEKPLITGSHRRDDPKRPDMNEYIVRPSGGGAQIHCERPPLNWRIPMLKLAKAIIAGQFEAGLCMLNNCIEQCPEKEWDGLIGKYPFWHVVYHTLMYVDLYLSPGEATFAPRTIHPAGWQEFEEEYPSRRFEKQEMAEYLALCRDMLSRTIEAETEQSLAGPSGFSRLVFSRAELHLYNMRHLQHHAGQLSAFLRRTGVDTKWVKTGWR
jgi:hypothetical protein